MAVPLAVGKNAVAGNARRVLHDGKALAAQFIEQGGLAHVGAAHHRYDRFAHRGSSFLTTLSGTAYAAPAPPKGGAFITPAERCIKPRPSGEVASRSDDGEGSS